MTEQSHLLSPDLGHDGQFAMERRGYSRMQVDEAIAQLRLETRALQDGRRDLEDRLSQALDEVERLKLELSAARSSGRPVHEELSENVRQILKLADDEARATRSKAEDEISGLRAEAQAEATKLRADARAETTKLRAEVKAETDRTRAEAQEQAERMLSAAREQADSTVSRAKAEADKTRKSAAAEAQRVISEAAQQAETTLATAKSQSKQQLDEATARATAIHDGAERRLNLLTSRHNETIRRLTEIRDVVTTLVGSETDRGSLDDEVARIVASGASAEMPPGRSAGGGRSGAAVEGGRHAGGIVASESQPPLSTAKRPGMAGTVAGGRPGKGAGPGSGPQDVWGQPSGAAQSPPGLSSSPLPVRPPRAVPAGPAQAGVGSGPLSGRATGPVPPITPPKVSLSDSGGDLGDRLPKEDDLPR